MNLKVEKQFNPWDVMFAKQSEFFYCQASWISKPISSKDDDVQIIIPPTVTIDAQRTVTRSHDMFFSRFI